MYHENSSVEKKVRVDGKIEVVEKFCSLLDVDTPIKIPFSLHILKTENGLLPKHPYRWLDPN